MVISIGTWAMSGQLVCSHGYMVGRFKSKVASIDKGQ